MAQVQCQLSPGLSLGPFRLGMPIRRAIELCQANNQILSHVRLKYCKERLPLNAARPQDPLSTDILVDLFEDGILLRFEPQEQRLKTIEVYDPQRTHLLYGAQAFCSRDVEPTFLHIYNHFGPTFPGAFDADRSVYVLRYPGLAFMFPIPQRYASMYAGGGKSASPQGSPRAVLPKRAAAAEMPIELPDGTSPSAQRIVLFHGKTVESAVLMPRSPRDGAYFQEVHVDARRGSVRFAFAAADDSATLTFNSSVQDVLSVLGRPQRIYNKEHDVMRIHGGAARPGRAACSDYFYNYFNLGVDVLFSIETHRIRKFVFHSNSPAHADFNTYAKCNYRLLVPADGLLAAPDGAYVLGVDSKWPAYEEVLGKSLQPVVYTRGETHNPFGPVLYYGKGNLIIEVMENDYVASVCLFDERAA